MRQQGDRSERHDVALSRPPLDFLGDVIGERHLGGLRRDRETVDLRQRAERDVAPHEEIAEQARIGRRRRRHVDEEAVERLRLLGRRQQIEVVALAHAFGLARHQDALVAHDQGRPRPRRQQAAPQIGAVGGDRIADDFLLELTRQIELDPPRQRILARKRNVEPPRRPGDGPTLDQQRGQHHHERDVEIDLRLGQAHQQRNRCQEDADRAAQPDPGDERVLSPRKSKRRQAQEYRHRAGDQHERGRHRERRPRASRPAAAARPGARAART